MRYHEREIPRENLERFVERLDSDEGIRIDNIEEHIFINRLAKRYCINISKINLEEFIYKNSVGQVTDFLKTRITPRSKIFAY